MMASLIVFGIIPMNSQKLHHELLWEKYISTVHRQEPAKIRKCTHKSSFLDMIARDMQYNGTQTETGILLEEAMMENCHCGIAIKKTNKEIRSLLLLISITTSMKSKMWAIINSIRVFSFLVMILGQLLFGIVEIAQESLFIMLNAMKDHNMGHSFRLIPNISSQVVDPIVLSKYGISETVALRCLHAKIKARRKSLKFSGAGRIQQLYGQ